MAFVQSFLKFYNRLCNGRIYHIVNINYPFTPDMHSLWTQLYEVQYCVSLSLNKLRKPLLKIKTLNHVSSYTHNEIAYHRYIHCIMPVTILTIRNSLRQHADIKPKHQNIMYKITYLT